MANTSLLTRRIKTAKNVSKTTKAMQMIATSKLKKAQDAAVQSRPYVDRLTALAVNLESRTEEERKPQYMKQNKEATGSLCIVISPEKGFCGGMVSNLQREVNRYKHENKNAYFVAVGKKAEVFLPRISENVVASFPFSTTLPPYDIVYPIVRIIDDYFLSGKVARVDIITTELTNLFVQNPITTKVLPLEKADREIQSSAAFTLFEPDLESLLLPLLKQYIEVIVYQNMLETFASEQAARTIAMKNATDNALEIVDELKLEYNKSRQEKITGEILDISGSILI